MDAHKIITPPSQPTGKPTPINWWAVAALLPTLAVGLWLVGRLFSDFGNYSVLNDREAWAWAWQELILPEIGWVAGWFVPFLLGGLAAGLMLFWRRAILGFVSGTVIIIVSYQWLCWKLGNDIAKCSKTTLCGEWSALAYGLYYVLCAVNVLALAGSVALFRSTRAKLAQPLPPDNLRPSSPTASG